MKAPTWLNPEAKSYYKRHQKQCVENGTLTDETHDTYCLLCKVWSQVVAADPDAGSTQALKFVSQLKLYERLAKPFGLYGAKPPEKKKAGLKELLGAAQARKG